MQPLNLPHLPKGTILSPSKRHIVAYLRARGDVTPQQLQEHFRNRALAEGKGVTSWLAPLLFDLKEAGHIEREMDGHGNVRCWRSVTDDVPHDTTPAADVAAPRRVSMFGPPWQPKPAQHRVGALSYRDHPSIINGHPQPFRSGR